VLRAFAPEGLKVAHDVAAGTEQAVTAASPAQGAQPAPSRGHGYSEGQRKALDDLVEKSR